MERDPSAPRPPRAEVDQFLPEVYEELRALALQYVGGRRGRHTLQPTGLVHEA